ncbi:hypothetical protein DIS24_g4174 [Lasiodiplodia hormozganensis]|uniref:DUF7730 domain-containing protein n=1 Tax=Lasiodiplodia hormozganensis TaxID=869390 RepID=A0AA40D1C7_9PEZI|nr:hypothetical protein DIS24_g4174 [Lasiodiplodia hormozganensis]
MTIHLFIFENKIRSVVCPRAPNTTDDDDYYWYTGDEEHKTEDEEEHPYILNHFLRHTKGVRRPRNRCDFCDSNRLRSTYISTVPRLPPTWGIGPDFLPLLLTCRRIYADAIPTLYSHPTFSTNHIYTLTDFLLSLPPPRLASLRSLHLVWPVPLNERHYPAASPSSSSDSFTSSATYASFISPYFASASASAPNLTPPPFGIAPPHDRVTWTAFWTLVATSAPRLRLVAVELVERGWWRRREWEAVIRPVAVVFGGGGQRARGRRTSDDEEEDDEYGHAVRVEGLVRFQRLGEEDEEGEEEPPGRMGWKEKKTKKRVWREKRWRVGQGWDEAKWVDGWEEGEDERDGVLEGKGRHRRFVQGDICIPPRWWE